MFANETPNCIVVKFIDNNGEICADEEYIFIERICKLEEYLVITFEKGNYFIGDQTLSSWLF